MQCKQNRTNRTNQHKKPFPFWLKKRGTARAQTPLNCGRVVQPIGATIRKENNPENPGTHGKPDLTDWLLVSPSALLFGRQKATGSCRAGETGHWATGCATGSLFWLEEKHMILTACAEGKEEGLGTVVHLESVWGRACRRLTAAGSRQSMGCDDKASDNPPSLPFPVPPSLWTQDHLHSTPTDFGLIFINSFKNYYVARKKRASGARVTLRNVVRFLALVAHTRTLFLLLLLLRDAVFAPSRSSAVP